MLGDVNRELYCWSAQEEIDKLIKVKTEEQRRQISEAAKRRDDLTAAAAAQYNAEAENLEWPFAEQRSK